MRVRIAFVTSHPIYCQAPTFKALAARDDVRLKVFFCHDHGIQPSFDAEFKQSIQSAEHLLSGYDYEVLRNVSPRPGVSFSGMVNPGVVHAVRSGEHDAVIVHGYNAISYLATFFAPRHPQTRVLLRGESNLLLPRSVARRAAKQVALRTLFQRVDHFLAIGSLNREYYVHYGVPEDRITLVPHSVDNEAFAQEALPLRDNQRATRLALGLPVSIPLFVYCAKLIPRKRPLDVIRAFAEARRNVDCGLVMIGDGPSAPDVRQELVNLGVQNDVHLLGFRSQAELPRIYAACDAMILASELETWGLVVNEAMACGLAIIASDQVGSSADLVREDNGAVFPLGNVARLSEIITEWARDKEKLRTCQDASLRRIRAWGVPQTVEAIVEGVARALAA